jgi:UDP-glucose 4-epimerase
MVVLVTGGSGFIGSHVVDSLIEKGYTVRVFDKIKPLNEKVEWFRGDLAVKDDLSEAARDVETVFHLAAVADVNVANTDPELCLTVNEVSTLNLLRACSGHEIDRFILASTVWVYGRAAEMVTEETAIPLPNDIYTKTKIGQESLVYAWCQQSGLAYTILRYDIPYGPRMRSNMAISAFVRRAMNKEPITVFGDGNQGRCWIYVTDLAEGNCGAMKQEARNQIINLAGREFVTISQIVQLLSKKLGDFPVRRENPRPRDFQGVKTSIEKAKRVIGWSPTVPFEDGLSRYIQAVRAS